MKKLNSSYSQAMESSRFNYKIKEIVKRYKQIYIDLPPRATILSSDIAQKNIIRSHGIPFLPSFSSSWFNTLHGHVNRLLRSTGFNAILHFLAQADGIRPLSRIVQNLRITKSPDEIKLLRGAGEITSKAFIEVVQTFNVSLIRYS